ncbi:MAG: pilin [Patescibacteria group bacterium]|jgi:uncharacterized membrane protein YwzB
MEKVINFKSIKIFFLVVFLLFGFLNFNFCQAGTNTATPNLNDAFKTPLENAAGEKGAGYNINNSAVNINTIISTGINTALSLLGVIFLILMIYAGYTWMMARGEEEKVTKAKETITRAIIGLIIVVAAYAISSFVISNLESKTMKSDTETTEQPVE